MALLGADLDPSARRANLMVSGIELAETRDRVLRVGSVRLLIGGETRPCERMEEAHAGLQEAMRAAGAAVRGRRSSSGGEIHVGDEVAWEPAVSLNLTCEVEGERAERASHASGARRRSGARERVSGSPRGDAPRRRLHVQHGLHSCR